MTPRYRGRLLSDRGIHADHIARTLVDDRVERDGRLAGAAIADDELPLAAAQGDGRIDDEHSGRKGPLDQRSIDDRRRRPLHGRRRCGDNRLAAVERPAKGIDDSPEERLAHRHPDDISRAMHDVAGGNGCGFPEQDAANRGLAQIDGLRGNAALDLEQLVQARVG